MSLTVTLRKIRDKLLFLRSSTVQGIKKYLACKKWIVHALGAPAVRKWLHLPSGNWIKTTDLSQIDNRDLCLHLDPGLHVDRKIPETNAPENRWWYEERIHAEIDPTLVLNLQNGRALGHAGGQYLNQKGDFIGDVGTEHWLYFESSFLETRFRLPPPKHYDETVAVLSDRYARSNYAHWVFDVLPKIGLLERTIGLSRIDRFLVGHDNLPYQLETLAQLGIPRDRTVHFEEHAHVSARQLIVPVLGRYHSHSHQPSTLRFLRDKFLLASPPTLRRRLFISRQDASFRHLLEEDSLCEKLAPFGFERVTLAGLSLEKTAELFASAEIIIGPFGSGLMNICFCSPGTLLIDIAPPEFYNNYHWYLSEESGIEYRCYFGNGRLIDRSKTPSQVTAHISVDVKVCMEFIQRMISDWERRRVT